MELSTPEDVVIQGDLPLGGKEGESEQQPTIWTPSSIALSLFLFLLAGLFEIGGGWLVFVGMRDPQRRRPRWLYIFMGSLVLIAYGFVPTLQPSSNFGRIFAVYGGFFVALSYLWGYLVDGVRLDIGDWVGSAFCIFGVLLAWFWPR